MFSTSSSSSSQCGGGSGGRKESRKRYIVLDDNKRPDWALWAVHRLQQLQYYNKHGKSSRRRRRRRLQHKTLSISAAVAPGLMLPGLSIPPTPLIIAKYSPPVASLCCDSSQTRAMGVRAVQQQQQQQQRTSLRMLLTDCSNEQETDRLPFAIQWKRRKDATRHAQQQLTNLEAV